MSGLSACVLRTFETGEPITVNTAYAARDREMTRKQVSDVVGRLEKLGLVEGQGFDGREKLYRITDAGQEALGAADAEVSGAPAPLADPGPAQRETKAAKAETAPRRAKPGRTVTRSVRGGSPAQSVGTRKAPAEAAADSLTRAAWEVRDAMVRYAETLGDPTLMLLVRLETDIRMMATEAATHTQKVSTYERR